MPSDALIPEPLLAGTLTRGLARLARIAPRASVTFPVGGGAIAAPELDDRSLGLAAAVLAAGVAPGELVGVLAGPSPDFLVSIFGLWRAGAAVTVLPVPEGLADADGSAARVAGVIRAAGLRHLVIGEQQRAVGDRLAGLVPDTALVPADGTAPDGARPALPDAGPDGLALVQFTSGSTSVPKGVMLTHRAVMAGLRAVAVSAGYRPGDVLLQWVPLFHDMGLIGMLSLLMYGGEVVVFPPAAFLRRPAEVLAYFSEHHATMMTGPNFSYDYLLDAIPPERLAALDLSRWRLAFNGAEPVAAATVARFSAALAPSGVTDTVMFPVYGMAEATLAVSFPRPGTQATLLSVDRDELEPGHPVTVVPAGHARAKPVVGVGYPVHGLEVRIAGEHGPLPPGCCGELQIRGDAVSTGYYGAPAASQKGRAGDGWLRTGDLGFSRDGELFILGRRKEMIIVYGQNFFPEDVEALVRPAPGVYRQRCVAFPLTGGPAEQMGVIAETEATGPAAAELGRDIAARLASGLGLSQVQIHLVEPRWIPRTTSGKWQRALSARRITQRKESEPA